MTKKTLKIIITGVEVVVGVIILFRELFKKKEEEDHDGPGTAEEK